MPDSAGRRRPGQPRRAAKGASTAAPIRNRTPRKGTGPTSSMASFTTKNVDPNSTAAPATARWASRSPRPAGEPDGEPPPTSTPWPSTSGTGFSGIVTAPPPRPPASELLEAALAQAGFHLLADDL